MAKKVKKAVKKAAPKKKAPAKKATKKAAPKKTAKKAAKKVAPKKKAAVKKAPAKKAAPTSTKLSTSKKAVKKEAPKKKVVATSTKLSTGKKPAKKASAAKAAPAPKNYVGINPYLTFAGNCEEAFNFYKSVFGGNFPYLGRFGEMPPMDGQTIPESEKNKIMHISLPIGPNSVLMGSDSSDAFGHATVIGNNFSISLNATSESEADKFYNGLSAGGKQTMPMSKTFWGSYFGMLVDKFGINWMVSFETPKDK